MISFRNMRKEDIPAGLSLCRSAGWNQLSREWELFLQLNADGCRVAVDETGSVVGTVTTLRYQDNFSWVGMVLVDPGKQRLGIGTQLLHEALKILSADETIKLDATPAGREVYLKLNFVDEYRLSRMRLNEIPTNKLPASSARPLRQSDFPRVIKFDREVFGADRKPVLERILKGAPQYAFVVEDANEIKGYCFGRPGYNYNQIGPVIAKNAEVAKQLLSAALRNCTAPVIADILYHTPGWVNWITSLGFAELRPLIRMYRGKNTFPGIVEKQFAILGPEFG